MNRIILPLRRRWNWQVFLVLVALIVPAVFAILPFEISRQRAYDGTDLIASLGWATILVDRLINILLLTVLAAVGLVIANRIGLGLPFAESWINRQPIAYPFRYALAIAWITAVGLVLCSLLLRNFVFDPLLNAMYKDLGIAVPGANAVSPVYGLLAALSAGMNEETQFRLFGLSLLAWLGGLLCHDPNGRPKPIVFWTANILFALGFGAAHLPTAAALGLPMTPLVVISHLVLNGMGGLIFGWLFWNLGLESAILAHFFSDLVVYTLIPLITMQNEGVIQYVVMGAVALGVLLALMGAFRCLVSESRRHQPQTVC